MAKGGGIGDTLSSGLETFGRIFAPQATESILNAPLERQTRELGMSKVGALQDLISGASGMQPAQTINIGGADIPVPPMKMSSQISPMLPPSMATGNTISPAPGLPAVPQIITDKSAQGANIGSPNATPLSGGFAPGSGMANFMQNTAPALAFKADPETMIKSMQQRALMASYMDQIPGLTQGQRAAFLIGGPEAGKAYAESQFPKVPDNVLLMNTYNNMPDSDPRKALLKNEIDKAGGIETDVNKIAETKASTAAHNAATANAGLVETKDAFNNPIIINKQTGEVRNAKGAIQPVGPEQVHSMAEKIGNYEIAPPTGMALRSPFWLSVMDDVSKNHPDYNAQNYVASQKAYSNFSAGKNGDKTRSGNVAMSHLMLLKSYGAALDNGDMKLANSIKNKLSDEFGGVQISGYDSIAPIVADEVTNFILPGGSALADRAESKASLTSAKGTNARNQAIDAKLAAMVGQLHGLRQQYERGTMRKDFKTWLSPEVSDLIDNKRFDLSNPNIAQPGGVAPGTQPPSGGVETWTRDANGNLVKQ